MRKVNLRSILSLFLVPLLAPFAAADGPVDRLSMTDGQINVAGQTIKYKATAGQLVIKDDGAKPKAEMFFVAYTKQGEDSVHRPITFVFNGGPGAAAGGFTLGRAAPGGSR